MEKTIIKLSIKAFIVLFIGTFLMDLANCGTILGALAWAVACCYVTIVV